MATSPLLRVDVADAVTAHGALCAQALSAAVTVAGNTVSLADPFDPFAPCPCGPLSPGFRASFASTGVNEVAPGVTISGVMPNAAASPPAMVAVVLMFL